MERGIVTSMRRVTFLIVRWSLWDRNDLYVCTGSAVHEFRGDAMSRIPVHTTDSAPAESRTMLESLLERHANFGGILNFQAQLAHSPAALAAYLGLRGALEQHTTLDLRTRAAIQLAVGAVDRCEYSSAIARQLLARAGATDEEIDGLAAAIPPADEKLAEMISVAREAAVREGHVGDATWSSALAVGWTAEQLAEAFVVIALTVFVDYFVAYAGVELDANLQPAGLQA
jgi:alkylhydroperoxidase family enzyme